jgi:hypothetical protein
MMFNRRRQLHVRQGRAGPRDGILGLDLSLGSTAAIWQSVLLKHGTDAS